MARKDLLKGLIDGTTPKGTSPRGEAPAPSQTAPSERRPLKGAIGAVNQSIEALKARAVLDLDPFLIDAGGLQDRLETDDAEDASLLASIREYGQQVPVLVRPNPEDQGRYQIVYGRRRVLALRELKQPVKALLRDLDDSALIMAQGQENTARRGLSFIEKCNFAAQMETAGYDRKAICDALTVDKTLVSRMLSIAERIGPDLIEAIGAAPNVGRDRWSVLANTMEEQAFDPVQIIGAVHALATGPDSNARFEAAIKATMAERGRPKPPPVLNPDKTPMPVDTPRRQSRRKLRAEDGKTVMGRLVVQDQKVVVTLLRAESEGFDDWLVDNLEEIHRTWAQSRGEE